MEKQAMNLSRIERLVREEVHKAMEGEETEISNTNQLFDDIGYQPITTLWRDFSVADKSGSKAIVDTYMRAKAKWKDNYKCWTEMCMVLEHKWFCYNTFGEGHDTEKVRLYIKLWEDATAIIPEWPDKARAYYYKLNPNW